MNDERQWVTVSRREILASVGAIGTVGALSGIGTAAYLSDVERTEGSSIRAGTLDLEIACDGANCNVEADGTVSLGFAGLQPGASGAQEITVTQVGNPSWLWLASTCPVDELESAIDVTVSFDRSCDGVVEYRYEGTLEEMLSDHATGVRPVNGCLEGGETGCLTFEWSFRNEPGVERFQGESLEFELKLYSLQCRHTEGTENPFADVECETDRHGISNLEIWTCTELVPDCACEPLGTLELSEAYATGCAEDGVSTDGIGENTIDIGRYDLVVDDDCEDTGYDVVVTSTSTNDAGETTGIAFELLDANGDPGPDLCTVVVKSGAEEIIYSADDLAPRSNSTEGELAGALR